MSKSLEERLRDAKIDFGKVAGARARHASKVPADVGMQFQSPVAYGGDVEGWIDMIRARSAARLLLGGSEHKADASDLA